jgi:hypothetical protein
LKLFDGAEYDQTLDGTRLISQLERVKSLMSDKQWRTLQEIQEVTCIPTTSISAHLRSLRKEKHGKHTVNRRRRGDPCNGLFEYQLIENPNGGKD